MNTNNILKLLVISLMILQCNVVTAVEKTYAKESQVTAFSAADQHGKAYAFKKGTRYLLVSFDMSTGKKANKQLHARGAGYLPSKKAVYIGNIYGMPKVGRIFALPKMKKYAHTIILADEENLLDRFPEAKGKVTVLKLDSQAVVQEVSYWSPGEQKIEDVLK